MSAIMSTSLVLYNKYNALWYTICSIHTTYTMYSFTKWTYNKIKYISTFIY